MANWGHDMPAMTRGCWTAWRQADVASVFRREFAKVDHVTDPKVLDVLLFKGREVRHSARSCAGRQRFRRGLPWRKKSWLGPVKRFGQANSNFSV